MTSYAVQEIFSFILDFSLASESFVCKIFSSIGNFDLASSVYTVHVHSCMPFFVLFRLVIIDNNNNDNNNNNFFDLEAFLQVPIHLQINK